MNAPLLRWGALAAVLLVLAFMVGRCSAPATRTQTPESPTHETPHDTPHTTAGASDSETKVEYICPMHPQIRQPEFGTCPICHMDLVPVQGGGEDSVIDIAQFSEASAALLRLETARVERVPLHRELRTWGEVVSASTTDARVSAWTSGRIERLYVNVDGAQVRAGDRVARVYAPALAASVQALRDAARMQGPSANALAMGARQQLLNAGLSAREIDALVASSDDVPRVTLRAHAAGTILTRHVREGDYVNEGDPILTLSNTNRLWAELQVPEDDLSAVEIGQSVALTSRSGAVIPDAKVTFIAPTIDPIRRSVSVRVEWLDGGENLRVGRRVYGTIRQHLEPAPLSIPRDAVLWTGERSVVFVVDRSADPPIYQPTETELGERWGDRVVVRGGIYFGEEIVSNGAFRIDATLYLRNGGGMLRQAPGQEAPEQEAPTSGSDHSGHHHIPNGGGTP